MAKECELLCPKYEEMTVVPAAATVAGEVIKYSSVLGFHITDFTATMLAAGESASIITKAEKCKVIKNTGEVWSPGEPVYWDPTNSWFTNVAGALDVAGHVIEAAATAAVVGYISFDGMAEFLKT